VRAAPVESSDSGFLKTANLGLKFQIKANIGARRACLCAIDKPYARKEHARRRAFFVVALLSCYRRRFDTP
jgi:hypothetical protein